MRVRVWTPLNEIWQLNVRPQKLMDQRKKGLADYMRYRQAVDRKMKIDPKVQDAADQFIAVNDALKEELPRMYELTKRGVHACLASFIQYQKDWWKNCQKKLLPLLEYEPEHTTSFSHDMTAYVERFKSDHQSVKGAVERLATCNGNLMNDIANFQSPLPSLYTDDGSSRKSSSRRTESISSDISSIDPRHRRSGGYATYRNNTSSFEAPPRSAPYPTIQALAASSQRALSPGSETSDITVTPRNSRNRATSNPYTSMDGTLERDYSNAPAMASAFLSPSSSNASSNRGSSIFKSALPMSDAPAASRSTEELPGTPADPADEQEVLFLAASLFEFNIAHDRREGGIPYLVYVPGEIFDVIGMKGELWLARNQDDPSRTVGWIWEKHFARILPDEYEGFGITS